jgi:O-antigen ligase
MTTLAAAELAAGPPAPGAPRAAGAKPIRDAGSPILLYVCLLFGLPSGLVFAPLGAAGSPAAVLGLGLLIWWLNARLVPRLGVSRGKQPLHIGLYAFQISAVASYLAGALRPMTGAEASGSGRGLLSICAWSGIVLVTADGLRTRESVDRVLKAVVAAGAFLAGLGIVEFFSGWNPATLISIPGLSMNTAFGETIARANFTRVQGTASHAIEFGVVLSMVLPLALHYAWFAADHKKLRWAAVLLISFALPMTVSRSAMLGLAIVLTVMFIAWPPERRWQVLKVAPLLVIALKLLVPGLLGAIRSLFTNIAGDPSTQGRTDDYVAVGYYVSHAPLFGRGISTFIPELYLTLDNAYLGWLIEAGVTGLLVLVGFLGLGVALALHVRTRAGNDLRTKDLGAALAAAILSIAVNFATFDALGFAMCAGLLFLLLGATGALWRLAPQNRLQHNETGQLEPADPPPRPRRVLALILPVLAAAIAVGLVLIPGVVRTEYSAQGAVLLLGPQQHGDNINPYGYSPYLDLSSEVAQRLVMSPQTAADLRAAGFSDNYTAAAGIGSLMPWTDRRGLGSLIRLDVRTDTPQLAVDSRDAVVRELRQRFAAAQLASGSPPTELIVANVATTYDAPIRATGNRKHAVVAAAGLGFAAGAICWYLLGRLLRRRARRRHATTKSAVLQAL